MNNIYLIYVEYFLFSIYQAFSNCSMMYGALLVQTIP